MKEKLLSTGKILISGEHGVCAATQSLKQDGPKRNILRLSKAIKRVLNHFYVSYCGQAVESIKQTSQLIRNIKAETEQGFGMISVCHSNQMALEQYLRDNNYDYFKLWISN